MTDDAVPRATYAGGTTPVHDMDDAETQPQAGDPPDTPAPASAGSGATRTQSVTCGRCGWPSVCVAQEGMRLLSFVCHWCGKTTVGVVDPTIKRTVIF